MTGPFSEFLISLAANTAAPQASGLFMWAVQHILSHTTSGRIKKADFRIRQGIDELTQVENSLTAEELLKAADRLEALRKALEDLENDSSMGWAEKKATAKGLASKCSTFYRYALSTSKECATRRWKSKAAALSESDQAKRSNAAEIFKEEAKKCFGQLASLASDSDTQATRSSVTSGSTPTKSSFRDSMITLGAFDANSSNLTTPTSDTFKCNTQTSKDPLDVTATTRTSASSLARPPRAYQLPAKGSTPEAIMLEDIRRS